MSSKLCSQLETVMRGEYGLNAATPFLGFHILYMGAVQDDAFREQYPTSSDANLRFLCVRLFFALPSHMAEPFRQIADEEYQAARRGALLDDEEAWNTNNTARRALAEIRLGMLWLIKQKAARLLASLHQQPDFPSFSTIQNIPASELARVWADFYYLTEALEVADAHGGKLPPPYTARWVEENAIKADWSAVCVREFVSARDPNQSAGSGRTEAEKRKWWPAFFD